MALASDGYRPGDSRRALLRDKAKDKVGIQIPKSKSGKRVKIDRYYDAAEKLLDSFDDAYDARELDDAYMLGKRFVSFSLEDLPKHPDYDSSRYDWQREENGKDIEYIFGRLKHINDLIDEEEFKNDPRSRAEKETQRRIKNQLNRRNSINKSACVDVFPKAVVAPGRRASTGTNLEEMQRANSSKYIGSRRSSLDSSANRRQVEPSSKDRLESLSNHERYESEGRRNVDQRTRTHHKKDSLDRHSSHELLRPDQMVLNIPNGSNHDRGASKRQSRSNRGDEYVRGTTRREPQGQKSTIQRRDRPDGYNNMHGEGVSDPLGRHSSHERISRRRQDRDLPQRGMKSRKSQSLRNVKEYHADEKSERSQGTWVGRDLRIKRRPSKTQEAGTDRNNSRATEKEAQDVRVYASAESEPHSTRESITVNTNRLNKSRSANGVKSREKASMIEISEDCALVKFNDSGAYPACKDMPPNTGEPCQDDTDDGSYSISSRFSYPSID